MSARRAFSLAAIQLVGIGGIGCGAKYGWAFITAVGIAAASYVGGSLLNHAIEERARARRWREMFAAGKPTVLP